MQGYFLIESKSMPATTDLWKHVIQGRLMVMEAGWRNDEKKQVA